MRKYEFVAKTANEAIDMALKELNCSLEELDIDIEEQSAKGFLGFLKAKDIKVIASFKKDKVSEKVEPKVVKEKEVEKTAPVVEKAKEVKKVTNDNSEKPEKKVVKTQVEKPIVKESKPAVNAVEDEVVDFSHVELEVEKKPVTPEEQEKVKTVILQFLTELTESMGIETKFELKETDDEIRVDIIGSDVSALIGRRGSTLDAIQYLTGLVVNKHANRYKRIVLDAENYRHKREEILIGLANKMADKAIKYRKPMVLEPMNPYERQVIHASLQSNTKVYTKSEGEDPFRRVIISPKR